jgi:SAM-dependent methyltransferase
MATATGCAAAPQWRREIERQEQWTRELRSQLYRRVNLWDQERVLDTGCGNGVITAEIASRCRGRVVGLDRSAPLLAEARSQPLKLIRGDAQRLPYADESFSLVVCHMTLLWVEEPGVAVLEMARVTRPGGIIMAMAEPDYGGRIDYPEDLTLGAIMSRALQREGGHPRIGRRLKEMFVNAGLAVEVGILGTLWGDDELRREFKAEWGLLETVAQDLVAPGEFEALKRRDLRALDEGIRVALVPIFWAIGRKGS